MLSYSVLYLQSLQCCLALHIRCMSGWMDTASKLMVTEDLNRNLGTNSHFRLLLWDQLTVGS